MSSAKTAEPIEMPFGLWLGLAQGIVRGGSLYVLRDVAMATNFGTKMAINWLCVNDSDTAISYVGEFEWSANRTQIMSIPFTYGTLLWRPVFGF